MMEKLFIFIAVLPVLATGYSPRTEYIEDHCGSGGSNPVSKDLLLRFSKFRYYIPSNYSCAMSIQNKDISRQVQVRVLFLDTVYRSDCSAGAIVIREGSNVLTPPYGLCGRTYPSTKYRTAGNTVTVELTNRDRVSWYGDFKLLVTAIYNTTNNSSCHGDDFQCNNGLCVSGQVICNGYNDCGDNSDEEEGCAMAAGVIAGIVFASLFVVVIFVAVGVCLGRRRRGYTRVTQVVREYPSVHQPSYTKTVITGPYQSV